MNDTARTPTAEPNPDSAPPRGTFNTPQAAARPPALAWFTEDAVTRSTRAGNASFRELVGGTPATMRRVYLPTRLDAAQVFDGKVVHGGCVIIDDPIDPGSERYQQARAGVPYPRGTRAQRRRTATARVQARRRRARTAKAAALGAWSQKTLDDQLRAYVRTAYQELAAFSDKLAWDGVPAGPYDPPPFVPVYYGVTVPVHPAFRVTCV